MKRQDNKTTIMLCTVLGVFVIWLALITAGCYTDGIKLFDLLEQITAALNRPWNISINQYSLKFVLFFLFAYAMGIGVY